MGMARGGPLTGAAPPRIVRVESREHFRHVLEDQGGHPVGLRGARRRRRRRSGGRPAHHAAERRYQPYSGDLPGCHDPSLLQRISRHFGQAERQYWSSGLQILGYEKVRETGYRTNGLDYIPRRYCRASAVMNDGKVRQVVYSIGESQSIIGWGRGVEWCIVGLDRNYAWGRSCMAAQP